MAIRRVIEIDSARCNGCGSCADACHEGAIAMVGGRARLMRDDYCDGLGDCLPACPMDAIHFVEREAAAYDEAAVKEHLAATNQQSGCPGSRMQTFERESEGETSQTPQVANEIATWPIQIKLVPTSAPYFNGCDLLIAADCTAFAHGNFHAAYMRGKVTIIGCPKLDMVDYSEKLTRIIADNDIQSIQMARMTVPCCGGLEMAVRRAIEASGKALDLNVVTFNLDGTLLE